MKRNAISRTRKFTILLIGTGVGFVSLTSSTYAQLSFQPPIVSSQTAGLINDGEVGVKESDSNDQSRLRVRSPNAISLAAWSPSNSASSVQGEPAKAKRSIRRPLDMISKTDMPGWPETIRVAAVQDDRASAVQSNKPQPDSHSWKSQLNPSVAVKKNNATNSNGSIAVDPAAFEQYSVQPVRETEPQTTFKFPVKTNSQEIVNHQYEPAQALQSPTALLQKLPTVSYASQPAASSTNRFTHMQISALQPLDRFASEAIPTTIETPMAIARRRSWSSPNRMLQPISKAKNPFNAIEVKAIQTVATVTQVSRPKIRKKQVKQPEFDLESEFPPASVSVFVEGPDFLKVNESGDYEIAIVNSSSEPTSVSSIRLQIPETAELLVIGREGKIDDHKRTLSWSIDELASGQQHRIRFRLKVIAAGKVDFPVTVSQTGRRSQTISQATSVR